MTLKDKLNKLNKKTRFHMPGHKGKQAYKLNIWKTDYTETQESGNLYMGKEPILSAEKFVANIYDAENCFFCTDGSSATLRASILSICKKGDTIICDRNIHKSAISAMVMLDLLVVFINPQILNNIPHLIDVKNIEKVILKNNPKAIIITSPNYFGINQDIKAISTICKKYNVKLIVDAAHAGHFPWIGIKSPIQNGADIACISIHKTLPALGQASILITNENIINIRENISMYASTSPSYPIMASIELSIKYMQNNKTKINNLYKNIQEFKKKVLLNTKFTFLENHDFTRIVILGKNISDSLYYDYDIAVEMGFESGVVIISTIMDTKKDFNKLLKALIKIDKSIINMDNNNFINLPQSVNKLSIRKAYFSPYKIIPLNQAQGKISAQEITTYPPGVAILYAGEIISKKHIEFIEKMCYDKTIDNEIKVIDIDE